MNSISPIAKYILDQNIEALEEELQSGWKLNASLQMTKHAQMPAIAFACETGKIEVIHWLITKKANLNLLKNPAIIAAGYGAKTTLELLLRHGANINGSDRLGRNSITMAIYGKNFDRIPFLVAQGFDVKRDGRSLRQAVFSRQPKLVAQLLELGFDPNVHERDQVFPHNPSAVHVAAGNINDHKTVKLLVENGADITLPDAYGDRPFHAAMQNEDWALIAYIKSLEPSQWHDEAWHLASLAQHFLPTSLLDICRSEQRKIDIGEGPEYAVRWIVLHPVLMLKAANFKKKLIVEIVGNTDNYDNFLVWYPAKQCLAYVDYEHGQFKALGRWEAFIANPKAFFDKYISEFF
jgi:uncharacterized protein